MMNTIPPETEEQLKAWNDARLEIMTNHEGIEKLKARVVYLRDRMNDVERRLEDAIINLEQPIGLKIGEDYIVVIQDPHSTDCTIQNVNFNFRQEIIDS